SRAYATLDIPAEMLAVEQIESAVHEPEAVGRTHDRVAADGQDAALRRIHLRNPAKRRRPGMYKAVVEVPEQDAKLGHCLASETDDTASPRARPGRPRETSMMLTSSSCNLPASSCLRGSRSSLRTVHFVATNVHARCSGPHTGCRRHRSSASI